MSATDLKKIDSAFSIYQHHQHVNKQHVIRNQHGYSHQMRALLQTEKHGLRKQSCTTTPQRKVLRQVQF